MEKDQRKTSRLVMGVSKLNVRYSQYSYNGIIDCYAGYVQQEPVAKCFFEKNKNENLEFLLLCTEETLKKKKIYKNEENEFEVKDIDGNEDNENCYVCTAAECLIRRICCYIVNDDGVFDKNGEHFKLSEKKSEDCYLCYELDFEERNIVFKIFKVNENKHNEGIRNLLVYLKANHEKNRNDVLWLGTNGGFRDMAMVLVSLVSLLRLYDIVPEQVLGVYFDGKTNVIANQNDLMDINRFIAGMEEFVNYGSARILNEYYKMHPSAISKKWLDAMNTISEGMQTCDLQVMKAGLKKLDAQINDSKKENRDDAYLLIFSDYIQKDYKELLKNDEDLIAYVIEYCFNKGLYQQTLTFIESGMPQWICDKGILLFEIPEDIALRKEEARASYKSDVNFVFDGLLNRINNEKTEGKWRWNEYAMIGNFEKNARIVIPKKWHEIIYEKGKCKTSIQMQNNEVIRMIVLHKTLKSCRNQYNHAGNASRVSLQSVDKLIKLYINYIHKTIGN